jgi:hypothetical protein
MTELKIDRTTRKRLQRRRKPRERETRKRKRKRKETGLIARREMRTVCRVMRVTPLAMKR